MKEIAGKKVILTEGEFLRREEANKRYLMKLETPYLLRSYLHEAGRYSGRGPDAEAFGGWEDLSCQLRGHFLGHWLSAAALHYQETEDVELKAKTEVILKELELCQKDNGGEWVCPIPEVLGCAKAYEVTGEEKWLHIVEQYWKCAVIDRGCFATGGQTQGEIWTPMKKLKARLGDKNQEHCTVYNMIRLAEFLFRQTKDPAYMHYIEYNVQNGIMAQTYCPEGGLLTYFLPMKAASRKEWAGERDSFFCCHGTMVQANAAWNHRLYYQEDDHLYVTMYADSQVSFEMQGRKICLTQNQDYMNGSLMTCSENNAKQTINETVSAYANKPDFRKYVFTIHTQEDTPFHLMLRIPDWIREDAMVYINDDLYVKTNNTAKFVAINRVWRNDDKVTVLLPIGLKFIPLPDDASMGAYRYGADVLAGITEKERILKLETEKPEDELSADTERQWGEFRTFYRTENQDPGISFKKLNEIGNEPYQIYFKVK